MKKLLLTLGITFCVVFGNLSAQNLSVESIEVGIQVENRAILGADSTFSPTVDTVFCLTKVTGAQDTTEIFHVWYYGEEEKARTPLSIKSSSWRTWSSKKILQSWTGAWRVAVEDREGNVLTEKSFEIE